MAWIEDETFENSLIHGRRAEAAIAAFYIRAGSFRTKVDCLYPAGEKRPDDGDILVQKRGCSEWKIIESKSYGYTIDSIESWPHIAIGRVHTIDRRGYHPDIVYAVAAGGQEQYQWAMFTKMFGVPKADIGTHSYKDKFSNDEYDMYVIPQKYWTRIYIGDRP